MNTAHATETLQDRLAYARERLANAERIGRPAHIARCRQRVEGLVAKLRVNHTDGGSGT
jgi:hypothetical protein